MNKDLPGKRLWRTPDGETGVNPLPESAQHWVAGWASDGRRKAAGGQGVLCSCVQGFGVMQLLVTWTHGSCSFGSILTLPWSVLYG